MKTIKLRAFLSALGLLSLGCTLFAQQENIWEETVSDVERAGDMRNHQVVSVDNLDIKTYLPDYQITQYSNTSPFSVYTEESITLTGNYTDFIRQQIPSMSEVIFVRSSVSKSAAKASSTRSFKACRVSVVYSMTGNTLKRRFYIACYYTINLDLSAGNGDFGDFIKPCEVYPFTKLKKQNGVKVTGEEFLMGARCIELFKEKTPLSAVGRDIDKRVEAQAAAAAREAARKKAEEEARRKAELVKMAQESSAKIDGKYYTKEQVLQLYQETLNKYPVLPKSRPVSTTVVNGVTIRKEDASATIDSRPDYDAQQDFFGGVRDLISSDGHIRWGDFAPSSIVRAEIALLPVVGDKSILKIVDTKGASHPYSEIEKHSFGLLVANAAYVVDKNTGAAFTPEWFESKQYIKKHLKPIINKRFSDNQYFMSTRYHSHYNDSCYVHLGAQFYKEDDASLWQLVGIPNSGVYVYANEKGETKTDKELMLSKDKVDYIMNSYKGAPARIFHDGQLVYDNATIKGLVVEKGKMCFDMGDNRMVPISELKTKGKRGWVITSTSTKTRDEIFNDTMNEIYRKYGRQTVMNFLSGNIKKGMSYDMMVELYKAGAQLEGSSVKITDMNHYTTQSGNKYTDVWLSNGVHFYVENGVVTDIFYHSYADDRNF